jgi:hypothetical protein
MSGDIFDNSNICPLNLLMFGVNNTMLRSNVPFTKYFNWF